MKPNTGPTRKLTVAILTKGPWLRYPYLMAAAVLNTGDHRVVLFAETLEPPQTDLSFLPSSVRTLRSIAKRVVNTFRPDSVERPPGLNIQQVDEGLNSPECVEMISELKPDYAINAWGTIFRSRLLDVLDGRLLNSHMGGLPEIRGMNAAEWSILSSLPIGNTVHIIDSGIDTGPILDFFPIEGGTADSIEDIRTRLEAQAPQNIVDAMLRYDAKMLTAKPQRAVDGKQYYAMHPNLIEVVSKSLKAQ